MPTDSSMSKTGGAPTSIRKRVVRTLHRNPLLSLMALFLLGVGVVLYSVYGLAVHLNEQNALRYAAQLSDTLFKAGQVYSKEVIARVKPLGVSVSHRHREIHNAIPVPATFSIMLAKKISQGAGPDALRTNLYSDFLFKGGNNVQSKDAFQKRSLAALGDGRGVYFSFEPYRSRPSLRYANALVMKKQCVSCHNTDPASPKNDWKIGDLRGAREVIIPMGSSLPIIRDGLIEILIVMLVVITLFLWVLSMVINALRDTNASLLRFVPKPFLSYLGKEEITEVRLGDSIERRMTVLFSDIRSFTTISEQLSPEATFAFVNEYLRVVGPVVRAHGGFIDKYIGDAVMALFDDPQAAVQAALEMTEALAAHNAAGAVEPTFVPIRVGIGLNTGVVRLGTIGEAGRMDGTVIGDAVNIAARVEGLTRDFGSAVLVTDATYGELRCPEGNECRFVASVVLRGKSAPVGVHEVLLAYPAESRAEKQASLSAYKAALAALEDGDFDLASERFDRLVHAYPDDWLYAHHAKRCRDAPAWDRLTR